MQKRWLVGLVVVGLAVVASGAAGQGEPAQQPPGTIAIMAGALIDGTGAAPVTDAVILIQGRRIVAAGPADEIEVPGGARLLWADGMTVLPGLINAHIHSGASRANLRAWAFGGVTTVRDLGTNPTGLQLFRDLVVPEPEMARLVAAGPLLTVPNGYPLVPFGGTNSLPITSVADARAQAEALLEGPADLLKLALETGTMFGVQIPVMSLEEARAIVEVAHNHETVASAHITSTVDLPLALDAGVDDLAHMAVDRNLTDTEIARVISQNVAWVPTLELWDCAGVRPMAVANLRRFAEAGGTVALGTDYDGYTCDWDLGTPMTEIRLMALAGMTPMEIIVAATRNGAEVSNLGDELGTIEHDKIADVIAVAGDPLADLEAIANVRLVIHDGVVIRNELAPPSPRTGGQRVR